MTNKPEYDRLLKLIKVSSIEKPVTDFALACKSGLRLSEVTKALDHLAYQVPAQIGRCKIIWDEDEFFNVWPTVCFDPTVALGSFSINRYESGTGKKPSRKSRAGIEEKDTTMLNENTVNHEVLGQDMPPNAEIATEDMSVPSLGEYLELTGNAQIDIARLIETRLLIQASSGGGKSWAIRRILEQTASHVQQLILDPEGEFRSLAENGNYLLCGSGPNDVPLTHGGELAYTLMENRTSAVIDLSELEPEERDVFVSEFVAQLIRLPQQLWSHTLVVIDEAHILCPQQDKSEAKKAIIDLCARGRKRGLCPVLATQRISKLHKSAAAELQNRIMGLTILDTDIKRAADEMGITLDKASKILPELNVGEFYVYGPALCKTINKVKVGGVKSRHGFLSGEIKPPTLITSEMRDAVTEKFRFVMKDTQEHADRFTINGDLLTVGKDRFQIEQNISFVVATNEFTGTKQLLQVQLLDPVEPEAAVEKRLRNQKLPGAKSKEQGKPKVGRRGRRLNPDVEAIVTECIHTHRVSGMKPPFASVYEDIGLRCSRAGYPIPAMMTVRKRIDWLPGKQTIQ